MINLLPFTIVIPMIYFVQKGKRSNDMDEEKLLIRIAEMYYQEDKNQSQISKELNIHRTTISRLLKRSREEGIVNITINYDLSETYSLEQDLVKKFGLSRAIVVPIASEASTRQKEQVIGKAAADYFVELLKTDMKIGFSWGHSLAAMVEEMGTAEVEDVTCLPMIGGPSGKLSSEYHVNTIAYTASKKIGARALLIDAPAIPETLDLKKALMENSFNQELLQLWEQLDIAVFGIGSPHLSKKDIWQEFYGKDILSELEEKDIAGDVVSHFFNSTGLPISSELDDRIIGITIDQLREIPIKIGIAESKEKARSISAALKGKLLTTLVTTEETAKEILKQS